MSKILTLLALTIASLTIYAGYTQRSALMLRQESQPLYWSRHGTSVSGRYSRGSWYASPDRATYGSFRGGGPGAGK